MRPDGKRWNRCISRVTIVRVIRRAYRHAIGSWDALLVLAGFLFVIAHAQGAEIEPRAYVNTPVGINFLIAGYAYTDGGLATAGSSPVQDAQLRMSTEILAYARTFGLWGKSAKFDVIVPYSELTGHAMAGGLQRQRNVSGFNDPLFRFSINFYGSPALSVKEFAGYQQDLLIGASVQVSAPLGQYDKSKLVNIGNNRWFVKPGMGISKAWGPFTLELSSAVFFFTDNNEYYGDTTLKQAPVWTSQVHATYNLGRGVWAALSWAYDHGGRTTVGGVRNDDVQNNSRVGATLALPVNRNNSVKLVASSSLRTTVGNDFDLVGIFWQYRWGEGL